MPLQQNTTGKIQKARPQSGDGPLWIVLGTCVNPGRRLGPDITAPLLSPNRLKDGTHLTANFVDGLLCLVVNQAHDFCEVAPGPLHLLVVEVCLVPDVFDLVSNPTPVLIHFFRRHQLCRFVNRIAACKTSNTAFPASGFPQFRGGVQGGASFTARHRPREFERNHRSLPLAAPNGTPGIVYQTCT